MYSFIVDGDRIYRFNNLSGEAWVIDVVSRSKWLKVKES